MLVGLPAMLIRDDDAATPDELEVFAPSDFR